METTILTAAQKQWVDAVWNKLDGKLATVALRSKNKLPFQTTDPVHNNMAESNIHRWTNGFWPGLMWLMYAGTGKDVYRETAETGEGLLDKAFDEPEKLSHDVGFMWKLASGPNYLLTGNEKSWQRMRRAADHLMGRFNPVGEFIVAWNGDRKGSPLSGVTIIDTMMNLPLLYWASREYTDPRFKYVAMKHAGLKKECGDLARKSEELILKEWRLYGHVHENYSAIDGLGCSLHSSDKFYHWGGLLAYIALDNAEAL